MNERPAWTTEASSELHELFEGLEQDSQRPGDHIRARMSQEFICVLQDPSPLRVYVDNAMMLRSEYGLAEKVNLLHSAFLYVNELEGRKFPHDAATAAQTVRHVAELCNNPTGSRRDDKLLQEFTDALFFKELQTTMPARYALGEIVMQATRERYPGGVEVLDVGSSIGQGLKSLALKHRTLGFPVPRVLTKKGTEDEEATIDLYLRMTQPSVFREGWCVDIKDVRDRRVQTWARTNLRPVEYNDVNFMRDWEKISDSNPDNVHFAKLDFKNHNQVDRFMDKRGDKKFDIALFNTVLYQMDRNEDDLANVLLGIEHVIDPEVGIALAQDSFKVTGNKITDIEITPENWGSRWTCAAYDMLQEKLAPGTGWQELAHAPNSRFDVLHLQPGTLVINGLRRTLREWIAIPYEQIDKFSEPARH
jgi:hypothetical protein